MKSEFYILNFAEIEPALLLICKMVDKIFAETKNIYIHTPSQEVAKKLDVMLWTFKDISFIPHRLLDDADQMQSVTIGYEQQMPDERDTLINLSSAISNAYLEFASTHEIVLADKSAQQAARDRFKQYRERGFILKTNKIN